MCSVPGACGDPRFIGGDGNAFFFHGRRDADFCVLSDRDLHINAHFIDIVLIPYLLVVLILF